MNSFWIWLHDSEKFSAKTLFNESATTANEAIQKIDQAYKQDFREFIIYMNLDNTSNESFLKVITTLEWRCFTHQYYDCKFYIRTNQKMAEQLTFMLRHEPWFDVG